MPRILLKDGWFLDWKKKGFSRTSILINNNKIEARLAQGNLPRVEKVITVKNRYIIPGFIDSHTHLIASGIELQRTDLGACRSLNQCLEQIRADLKRNDIVFGVNWDESNWSSYKSGELNRRLLDRVSRKKPIVIRRVCGHLAVVNSRALNQIPENWKVVEQKTGYLYESAALNLNEVFRPSSEIVKKAIFQAVDYALKKGITSVQEITSPGYFRILQQLKDKLKIRFSVYLPVRFIEEVIKSGFVSNPGDERLKFSGLKVFIDGSIGARTAALKGYYKKTRRCGKVLVNKKGLKEIVLKAENYGLQLMIHSIGDRATELVLDVFKKTISQRNPLRHRLEHIEILDERMIKKLADYNIIGSIQPNFVRRWQGPGGMYEKNIGPTYRKMNCVKRLVDARVRVVFGSDCMPIGPLYGIEGAVYHPSSDCRLRPIDGLRLYTKEPAYATFDEDKFGSIKQGNFADLVVLNKNPLEIKNIGAITVLMVMVNGRIVCQRRH